MFDAVINLIEAIGYAAILLVTLGIGMSIGHKRSEQAEVKETKEAEKKADKSLGFVKRRMAYQRLLDSDQLDDILDNMDEFEDLVEIQIDDHLKRQSKKFLECSLNLMAHSYESMDEARDDAIGILQLAFEDDIIDRIEKKDGGGERVNIA